LLDLDASINLIPLSMLKKIEEIDARLTRMTLQLVDRSIKHPYRVVEDLLVKVDKFLFPVDFVVMDIKDLDVPLILGRPFMKTAKVIIDVDKGKLKVCVEDEEVSFNVFKAMKHPNEKKKDCFRLDVIDEEYSRVQKSLGSSETLLQVITKPGEELVQMGDTEALALATMLDQAKEFF